MTVERSFDPTQYVDSLQRAKADNRAAIYSSIIQHTPHDIPGMLQTLHDLDTFVKQHPDKQFYANQIKQKISERQIRERSGKPEALGEFEQNADLILREFNGANADTVKKLFRTYMNIPVQEVPFGKPDERKVWKACEDAIAAASALGMAINKIEDPKLAEDIMRFWRSEIALPKHANPSIFSILTFAKVHGINTLSEKAYAATILLDGLEVKYIGEINPMIDIHESEKLAAAVDKVAVATGKKLTEAPHGSLFYKMNSLIDPEIDAYRKGRHSGPTSFIRTTNEEDAVAQAALSLYMKNVTARLNSNEISHQYPKTAQYVRLAGEVAVALPIENVSEEEFAAYVNFLKRDSVHELMRKFYQKEQMPTLDAEDMNVIIETHLDRLDAEWLTYYAEEKRHEALSGEYGLSKRGDKVVISDDLSGAIGIQSITFKKFHNPQEPGQRKRITIADIDMFGTIFRLNLNTDYQIEFPEGIQEVSKKVIESVVYTYLAELRSGKHDKPSESKPKNANAQESAEPHEWNGVRPFLRVLPEGAHSQRLASDVSLKTEHVDFNARTEDVFGYSLSQINFYLSCAQMDRNSINKLPDSLRSMLNKLLTRIEQKANHPQWRELTVNGQRVNRMSFADDKKNAKIAQYLYDVTYVDDYSREDQPPKPIVITAEDLATLYKKQ